MLRPSLQSPRAHTAARLTLAVIAASSLLAGCAGRESGASAWHSIAAADLNEAQQAQAATATAAREVMVATLMGALSSELKASGPAAAIGVCRDVAPAIASSVGQQFDVRIGRVSHKLRNSANAAPAWTDAVLAEAPEEPRMVVGPDGTLGVTTPLRIASKCLLCHGPQEALGSDVREALGTLYPHDAATGYSEGDLRGWLWVEVAAPAE